MRIGVNARRLEGQRLGVGRYIEYLVKHWGRQREPSEEITLYLREQLRAEDRLPDGITAEVLRPSLTGLAWESANLLRRTARDDVLFCPSYSAPLVPRTRTVVAIHSTNEVASGTHPWWYRYTYSPLYRRSALRAARVVVPSQSVLEDIQSVYGIPAERLVVVPQGVDESFGRVDDPERHRQARLRWLGEDVPFVVFVGKLSQRRNIPTLLRAFAHVKKENGALPHKLLLMGPNHLHLPLQQLAGDLGIADSVVQTDGRVDRHAELADVYSAADLYVNPSLYEGFSMTLVEALACGTPVVVANRAALPEIAGDAGILVDDPAPEPLAEAMRRVLADPELRSSLRERGLERARAFQWEDTARMTLDVLRDVAEG